MRRVRPVALLGLSLLLGSCGQPPTLPDQGQPSRVEAQRVIPAPGQLLVIFKDGTDPAEAALRVARAGGHVIRTVGTTGVVTVRGDAQVLARLSDDGAVLAAGHEQFRVLAKEPFMALPASMAPGAVSDPGAVFQWNLRRLGAPAAAQRVGAAQANVTVAVVDTGVMHDHPDLAGQVTRSIGTGYCPTNGPEGAGGYPIYSRVVDLVAHPNWTPADGCVDAAPTYFDHGTHVAGIVAGKIGGGDIVGVAPGVRIAAYKVFDRIRYIDPTSGQVVDNYGVADGPIFQAVTDAADRGVDVVNMSLGWQLDRSNPDDNAFWVAWKRVVNHAVARGTLLVAAAGNSAMNTRGTTAFVPSDVPGVMSVSATGVTSLAQNGAGQLVADGPDVLTFYSNHGASTDIAAPGGDCGTNPLNGLSWCLVPESQRPATWYQHLILSSVITPEGTPWYGFYAGTSMAAPHVVAVAALVKAQHPEYNANQLRAHLTRSAEAIGPRQDFGSGLVSADWATR